MEGADVYAIAKNCRTSVEMIEKFYAAHIKTTLDASIINARKPRRSGGQRTRGNKGGGSAVPARNAGQHRTEDTRRGVPAKPLGGLQGPAWRASKGPVSGDGQ
jgi:hypothetical protein